MGCAASVGTMGAPPTADSPMPKERPVDLVSDELIAMFRSAQPCPACPSLQQCAGAFACADCGAWGASERVPQAWPLTRTCRPLCLRFARTDLCLGGQITSQDVSVCVSRTAVVSATRGHLGGFVLFLQLVSVAHSHTDRATHSRRRK